MTDSDLYCLGIVPARGGSKGLPGKNLMTVGGESLVRRAVEAAIDSGCCSRVICSTDSDTIAAEAVRAGADVPFRRPPELSGDEVGTLDVLIHAVERIEAERSRPIDLVCLVEPTTPLREASDIRSAMEILLAGGDALDSVVSLCEVTDAHPAWLRRIDRGRMVPYFGDIPEPHRRQDLAAQPTPYRRNGAVYLTRRNVLIDQRSIYGKNCAAYVMPPERSVNIDSRADLLIAQALWEASAGRPGGG